MAFLCALPLAAESDFYQFRIDQDALSGAADFSFLNRPLTPADRIFVCGGHFCRVGKDLAPDTPDDERVRLFGVNLAFGANFPEAKDAVRIARRLRRLGVNLVRLHHMDTQPDANPANAGCILTRDPYPTLNQVSVARLRTFLDALRAEGIYANVNLHVGYEFRPGVDRVPSHPAFPKQSKPLHIFFPRMVELQVEFTRKVLEALALKGDPVLAMVEIDNESSLVRQWQTSNLDQTLVGDYKIEFQRQWNAFLREKYSATAALGEAWGASEPDGGELLSGNWVLEKGAPSNGTFESTPDGLRVVVTSSGPRLILKQVGFSVAADQPYAAELELRIDAPDGAARNIYFDVKQDVSPWRTMASRTVAVTNQWRKFRLAFTPVFAMDRIGRLGISIENLDVPMYVRGWSLRSAGRRGLAAGETLEAGNVALVGETDIGTAARTDDYLLFLAARDRAYLDVMLGAVRASTDALVPVAGTQMGFGGLLNLDSHDGLDYQDNHFYVDHYNFPNVAWDGRDWRMRDQSNVGSGMGAFRNMAVARQAGRPYTVSEFNQPWPNTYAAEIDPTLAAFGALQDWDAIVHFAYSHGRGWDDGAPNGFNINGDWTKFPSLGQAAWLFRSGAIAAAHDVLNVGLSRARRLESGREKRNSGIGDFLTSVGGFEPDTVFVHRIQLVKDDDSGVPAAARVKPEPPYVADTDQMTYDPRAKLFTIHAERAAGVIGFPGLKAVRAGVLGVELGPSARGFVALVATPLDGVGLAQSSRLLLTTPGYTLRTQPGSDPLRPQHILNYLNTKDWWTLEPDPNYPQKPSGNLSGGLRPAWMERIESYVTLWISARRITVYPLGGSGARLRPLPEKDVEAGDAFFRIHLQADGQSWAPWYEIIAER